MKLSDSEKAEVVKKIWTEIMDKQDLHVGLHTMTGVCLEDLKDGAQKYKMKYGEYPSSVCIPCPTIKTPGGEIDIVISSSRKEVSFLNDVGTSPNKKELKGEIKNGEIEWKTL